MTVLEEVRVPQESVNDEFARVVALHVESRDPVEVGTRLVDVETSKTVLEIESTMVGFADVFVAIGDDVPIGAVLLRIVDQLDDVSTTEVPEAAEVSSDLEEGESPARFSPNASTLIEKLGMSKERFSGLDLVTENDVRMMAGTLDESPHAGPSSELIPSSGRKLPTVEYKTKRLSPAKRSEIRILSNSVSDGLTSSIHVFVNWEGGSQSSGQGIGVLDGSVLPIVILLVSRLLRKYPLLNGFYIEDAIAEYEKVNVGIAIDVDDGLKVVTLRNTDKMVLPDIETELVMLIDRYLQKDLTVSDLTESTFTITDMSSLGVDLFVPVINMNQSAILGISDIDSKLERFGLSVVFDHRVTEGKMVASFLTELKSQLELYLNDQNNNSEDSAATEPICDSCLMTIQEDRNLGGLGLVRLVTEAGVERCICRNCLLGF